MGGTTVSRPFSEVNAGGVVDRATADLAHPFERDDFDRDVWSIFGVPVDLATAPQAVQMIEAAARDRRRLSFITPNVNFLVRALRDAEARRRFIDADLSLVDGAPLVALGMLTGVPVRERCAGSDVFEALRRRPGFPGRRLRVFFFGGRDGSAAAAAAAVDAEGRGVEAAGHLNPGDGDVESMSGEDVIAAINAAQADFVLVALGVAKGQAWIDRNRERLSAPVISHLGAVVDFTSGAVRRAPAVVRRFGLEWAWRIKEDPALWRRYWDDARGLAAHLIRHLPAALSTRRAAQAASQASAALRREAEFTVIELSGDLVAENRAALRRAFRAAAAEGRDVVLDLGAAARLDGSFLGLVLMLEKRLRRGGSSIRLANASPARRRLFSAHAMEFGAVALPAIEPAAAGRAIAAAV